MRINEDEDIGAPSGPPGPEAMIPKIQLLMEGVVVFMGDVTVESMSPLIDWILAENFAEKRKKELTLGICSRGGDLNACFALVDVMKGSKIPIRTVGMGMIASCGLLMFITGEKGRRVLTPNTSILSHQYSWGSIGKEHELFARVRELELTTERMINHYKKCTGLNESAIRKYLLPPHDVWLGAKEAKKLGLCDKVEQIY
jgi:ATP-dependent Clp protease protease subunit|tara:strand:- start:92 stop:691 length:600 start_codon:yes stop_codon:yes gene_type:complete